MYRHRATSTSLWIVSDERARIQEAKKSERSKRDAKEKNWTKTTLYTMTKWEWKKETKRERDEVKSKTKLLCEINPRIIASSSTTAHCKWNAQHLDYGLDEATIIFCALCSRFVFFFGFVSGNCIDTTFCSLSHCHPNSRLPLYSNTLLFLLIVAMKRTNALHQRVEWRSNVFSFIVVIHRVHRRTQLNANMEMKWPQLSRRERKRNWRRRRKKEKKDFEFEWILNWHHNECIMNAANASHHKYIDALRQFE